MNRQQATAVLREILAECDGGLLSSSVSLDSAEPNKYKLTINCTLDETHRECVNRIIKKNKLHLKEHDGKVTILSTA